jgi:hypothetical protein
MNFNKQFFKSYDLEGLGVFKNCDLYTVFKNGTSVGQFISNSKTAYILTEKNCLQIDIRKSLLNKSEYIILTKESNEVVGFYDLPVLRFARKTVGNLTIYNKPYSCERQKTDIKFNVFKKATWGHYAMKATNENCEIFYKLKVATNWINANDRQFRNAEGEIVSNLIDHTVILAGLFLIEKMLFNIDVDEP